MNTPEEELELRDLENLQDMVVVRTITCPCGEKLELTSSWANQCECGTEFNGAGQRLAPRCDWGEETGEDFQ